MIAPEDLARRPSTFCFTCGGSFRTLGSESRYVPHEPDCPRNPLPQTSAEQDTERAALADVEAPFIASAFMHDPFDCPDPTGDHCEQARRLLIERSGGLPIPGLAVDQGERHELVEPERARLRRTIRSTRRLTPNYGDDGVSG